MELFCVDIDADSIKLQEPCNKAQKQMLHFIYLMTTITFEIIY